MWYANTSRFKQADWKVAATRPQPEKVGTRQDSNVGALRLDALERLAFLRSPIFKNAKGEKITMILHKAFFGISSALFILMTDNPFMVIACALCASIWLFSISYEVDANIKQEVFWRKYFAGELD